MSFLVRKGCKRSGVILSVSLLWAADVPARRFVLPVAARARGVDGTEWRTWTEVYVPSIPGRENETVQVREVVYSIGSEPRAFLFRMHAGEGGRFGDEVLEGLSAIAYELPDDWRLVVSARIFHERESGGVFGQVVRGMPVEELLSAGDRGVVVGGERGLQRSNIGWFQYEAGVVVYRLFEADGWLVHEEEVRYGDGEVWGSDRIFGELLDGRRTLEVEIQSGSGIGYVSIIDSFSGDPEFRYFRRVTTGCNY